MYCEFCGKENDDSHRFCIQCGKELATVKPGKCSLCGYSNEESALFCIKCGNPVTAGNHPARNTNEEDIRKKDVPASGTVKSKPVVEGKKKFFRAKNIILLAIAFLIVAITALFLYFSFPLEVDCQLDGDTTTITGEIDNIEISVDSNQLITGIYYAVDPVNPETEELYTKTESTGSMFNKTAALPEITLPVGESTLYVYVKTVFGKSELHTYELFYDIGHTSLFVDGSLVKINEDIQLISNELILFFKNDITESEVEKIVDEYGGTVVGAVYPLNNYQIRFEDCDQSNLATIMTALESNEKIKSVNFNLVLNLKPGLTSNDEKLDSWDVTNPSGNNWGLECIDAPGAWDYNDRSGITKVGVIDSSLDFGHDDLQIDESHVYIQATDDFKTMKDLIDYYKKYPEANASLSDEEKAEYDAMRNHGTHCTGIIGAVADNEEGITGANWKAEMYFSSLWYYEDAGQGNIICNATSMGICYAIDLMVMSGCRVVSMSFGDGESSDPSTPTNEEISATGLLNTTVQTLEEAGYDFLFVKAAGNENDNAENYMWNRVFKNGESTAAHTIIVGNVENSVSLENRLADWIADTGKIYNMNWSSNYGELVDVTAPGTNIYSTVFGDKYENMSGTSMATPMVAGVASLIYSMDPDMTYDAVKVYVCTSAANFCSKKGKLYGIVNAKNALGNMEKFAGELPVLEKPVLGFVTGLIQDAKTKELIPNVAIQFVNEATGDIFESATENGTYEYTLAPGTYTMTFAAQDYVTETVYHIVVTADVINYNVLLNLVQDEAAPGVASGRVINAFNASSIPNASMKFYAGINQTSGTPVATATSDSNGQYSVELAPGNYTVDVAAEHYQSGSSTILIISGETIGSQDCTLTPILNPGEVRFVLTWGQYPSDLDSHLTGPSPDGSPFHIFFSNKNHIYNNVAFNNLDVDDTTSYGPETTSIYQGLSGKYTFYVHDYSNGSSTSSSQMGMSGAQVKVYIAGQKDPIVFNVPNQSGTLWTVCTIEDGVVTPVNAMGYESIADRVGR